jgi:hypothetical protein
MLQFHINSAVKQTNRAPEATTLISFKQSLQMAPWYGELYLCSVLVGPYSAYGQPVESSRSNLNAVTEGDEATLLISPSRNGM